MTQENTSASETLSSNASELASQAEMLAETVSFFRTGEEGMPLAVAAKHAVLATGSAARLAARAKPAPQREGGFDFELGRASGDDLDAQFKRREAA